MVFAGLVEVPYESLLLATVPLVTVLCLQAWWRCRTKPSS